MDWSLAPRPFSGAPVLPGRPIKPFDWRSMPGILLVNPQVCDEAVSILYMRSFELAGGCLPHMMQLHIYASKTYFAKDAAAGDMFPEI